jgi:hypothetical protein
MSAIRRFYLDSGKAVFNRAGLFRRFHYKYEAANLAMTLQAVIGKDTTLGSPTLRTLLPDLLSPGGGACGHTQLCFRGWWSDAL